MLREVKRKIALERWASSQERLKQSLKLQGREVSDETREKQSLAMMENSFVIAKSQVVKERGYSCERCGKVLGSPGSKKNFDLCLHHLDGCQWNNDPDNLLIVCRQCHSKFHNEFGKVKGRWAGSPAIANYMAKILLILGVDLDHPDFKETPLRVARCFKEMFEGYGREGEVEEILEKWFPTDNDEMVVTRLETHSLCPHHLLPVEYDIVFGYLPKGRAIGLSKVVRICELLAKKPILQENLTTQITSLFSKHLHPKGCAVMVSGRHSCMRIRGVKADNSEVMTSSLIGAFHEGPARSEFFQLAKLSKL
jgi:GTP cyclohydrolase I